MEEAQLFHHVLDGEHKEAGCRGLFGEAFSSSFSRRCFSDSGSLFWMRCSAANETGEESVLFPNLSC